VKISLPPGFDIFGSALEPSCPRYSKENSSAKCGNQTMHYGRPWPNRWARLRDYKKSRWHKTFWIKDHFADAELKHLDDRW